MTEQTNEVVTTEDKKDVVPEFLKGVKASGLESMNSKDFMLPMVKLLQAISPEVLDKIGNASAGTFFHTNTEESLGTSIRFIIAQDKRKYLLLAPLGDERKVLARADDGVNWTPPTGEFEVKLKGKKDKVTWKLKPTVAESGLDKFGSSDPTDPDSKPAAVLVYEYLIHLVDYPEMSPVVLSLARSQIKKAKKQLHGKIEMRANAGIPMQAQIYKATVVNEQGAEGTYFNYQFSSDGTADEATYKAVMDVKERLADYKVSEDNYAQAESSIPENSEI